MNNLQISRKKTAKGILAGAVLALALGTVAEAAPQIEIVNLSVNPISPGVPEIILQNVAAPRELVAAPTAPGAQGNADGKQAADGLGTGTPGGFQINTPVQIPILNGLSVDRYGGKVSNTPSGLQTSFFDVSLELSGLKTINSAVRTVLIPSIDPNIPDFATLSQKFETGTFTLYTTYRDDNIALDRQVLLTGTITNLVLVGIEGTQIASLQSSQVQYTSGPILQGWLDLGGNNQGSLSWSLTTIVPTVVAYDGPGTVLRQFQADLGGHFNATQIPEPASVALMALSGIGLFGRFRRTKKVNP